MAYSGTPEEQREKKRAYMQGYNRRAEVKERERTRAQVRDRGDRSEWFKEYRQRPEVKARQVKAQAKVRQKKQQVLRDYKASLGCRDCGEKDWVVLELHHRDPGTKNPKLSSARVRGTGGFRWTLFSYAEMAAELEKCDVLCANCHRRETYRRNDWKRG